MAQKVIELGAEPMLSVNVADVLHYAVIRAD